MDPSQLKKIPLFANLTSEHLSKVAAIATQRECRANDKIFSEGDVGTEMFLIMKGKVRISKMVPGVGEEALAILEPGSYFGEMALIDENKRPMERPWYFVKDIQGVIGFVGGERPMEVTADEIAVIKEQVSDSEDTEKPKVNFEVGETVKINDGPFLNFSGMIEEIEPEKGKLKVTVDIFGRKTPVELEYWQVEKS